MGWCHACEQKNKTVVPRALKRVSEIADRTDNNVKL